MARLLTLDFDSDSIYLLAGEDGLPAEAGRVPLGQPLTTATAAEAGKGLREFLKENNVTLAPVIALVGRDRTIWRDVLYPNVDSAEEPNLIRFQVTRELTEAPDTQVIDYAPQLELAADGQKKAVCGIIRKDYLQAVQGLCEHAGLKLIGVLPRAFAFPGLLEKSFALAAVEPPSKPYSAVATIVRTKSWGEMVVSRGSDILFSRVISGPALESEAAFVGEIKRNLIVFDSQNPNNPVDKVYLPEGEHTGSWVGRLQAGLSQDVRAFDPLGNAKTNCPPGERSYYAALAGAVNFAAPKVPLPLNFLAIRQPPPKTNKDRNTLLAVGLAFCLLLGAGYIFGNMQVNKQRAEVERLRKEKDSLVEQLSFYAADNERFQALKDWKEKRINWLDELYDLTTRFPNIDTTQVTKMTFLPQEQSKTAKGTRYPGKILVDLVTESSRAIDGLQQATTAEGFYKVEKETKGITGTLTRLNQLFTLKLEVQKRPPTKYTSKLVATPPPTRNSFGSFTGTASPGGGR